MFLLHAPMAANAAVEFVGMHACELETETKLLIIVRGIFVSNSSILG